MRAAAGALLLACLMAVAGCKADLYSSLTEVEANQMMAALMANGITAEKVKAGETFTLRVEEADMVAAIATLDAKGYPKQSRQSIGSVFQKSGIISSPFEERVRYIYALGEDVAQTLAQIDGVVTARVHVVLPEEPKLGEPVKPSSAAVFIKHDPMVDLEYFVPQIRRLVSSAIEGLDYSAVVVVLTEAIPAEIEVPSAEERLVDVLPGLAVREADVGYFWQIVYVAVAVVGLLLAASIGAGAMLIRQRRRGGAREPGKGGSGTSATALEPS